MRGVLDGARQAFAVEYDGCFRARHDARTIPRRQLRVSRYDFIDQAEQRLHRLTIFFADDGRIPR